MHIAEGFLPPVHAAVWTAAAAPFVVWGVKEVVRIVREHPESKILLGAMGAFSFVLSAIKLPSVTGSSSHPTGTSAGAIIFRPPVMAALGVIVLLFQALLLSHGGLTTLGANIFSMAVVGPWVAYGVFLLLRRFNFSFAVFLAVALGSLSTYAMTATQLALAFPDAATGFFGAWGRYLALFAVTQIPLSIVEGLITVILMNVLISWAGPELRALGLRFPASSSTSQSVPSAAASPVATPAEEK